jgi:hypothetical protein
VLYFLLQRTVNSYKFSLSADLQWVRIKHHEKPGAFYNLAKYSIMDISRGWVHRHMYVSCVPVDDEYSIIDVSIGWILIHRLRYRVRNSPCVSVEGEYSIIDISGGLVFQLGQCSVMCFRERWISHQGYSIIRGHACTLSHFLVEGRYSFIYISRSVLHHIHYVDAEYVHYHGYTYSSSVKGNYSSTSVMDLFIGWKLRHGYQQMLSTASRISCSRD